MSELTGDAERAYGCLVSHLDNPMFVVTASSPHGRGGCLVGFATQCSMHPPRWCVGISKLNHTFEIAATARLVAVHALGAGNMALARLFGEETGDDVDKFSRCEWHSGPDANSIVLTDCPRWFAGEIVDRIELGDHLGLVLAPVAAECEDHGPQLGFQAVRDFHPGHPA